MKVNIHDTCHVIVPHVRVFISSLFRSNDKFFSLLYAHLSFYHENSIAMLYIVHKYKKKFEWTNL